jgi:hypothetical protein
MVLSKDSLILMYKVFITLMAELPSRNDLMKEVGSLIYILNTYLLDVQVFEVI